MEAGNFLIFRFFGKRENSGAFNKKTLKKAPLKNVCEVFRALFNGASAAASKTLPLPNGGAGEYTLTERISSGDKPL